MIDDMLKLLLSAQTAAEQIVADAIEARQVIIEQAKRDVLLAEQQHAGLIAEIHASHLAQAEQRAQQTIATLQRSYDEQAALIRASAMRHQQQALDLAFTLLVD
jgi:aspartokinase-like uncharacterized kinase